MVASCKIGSAKLRAGPIRVAGAASREVKADVAARPAPIKVEGNTSGDDEVEGDKGGRETGDKDGAGVDEMTGSSVSETASPAVTTGDNDNATTALMATPAEGDEDVLT